MFVGAIKKFVRLESSSAILLAIAAVLAMVIENSPLFYLYERFLDTFATVSIGAFQIKKPLLLWINDGLMAAFFLLVGLEIKREVMEGELSDRKKIVLPALAALGGMVVPALIYVLINFDNADNLNGWAIPAATDIAFALGAIALLGKRVPQNLKVILLAIAIFDDLAAIVIIALFYTQNLSIGSLLLSFVAIAILALLNLSGVKRVSPYIVVGVLLWACVLKSGVHATLAGVTLAFFIPMKGARPHDPSPLKTLENGLHPWVAYCVLPFFAFANAGVPLHGLSLATLSHPITLGVTAGLFVGKQCGIFLFSRIGAWLSICKLPRGVTWAHFYGMSAFCGIGFTMSFFIGTLAFDEVAPQNAVRLGVLLGTILSGIHGWVILMLSTKAVTSTKNA